MCCVVVCVVVWWRCLVCLSLWCDVCYVTLQYGMLSDCLTLIEFACACDWH